MIHRYIDELLYIRLDVNIFFFPLAKHQPNHSQLIIIIFWRGVFGDGVNNPMHVMYMAVVFPKMVLMTSLAGVSSHFEWG